MGDKNPKKMKKKKKVVQVVIEQPTVATEKGSVKKSNK